MREVLDEVTPLKKIFKSLFQIMKRGKELERFEYIMITIYYQWMETVILIQIKYTVHHVV